MKPDQNRSDLELGEAVRMGDMDAFRHLFAAYYPTLCSFAMSIVKRRDMADDVCSRVFEELWRKRSDLHITTSLKGYLYSAVRNRCINLLRSDRAFNTGTIEIKNAERELTEDCTPKDHLNAAEFEIEVKRLLDGLPEQRRTAFILSRFDNLRYKEIAAVMGISEHTVQNHIVLAVKHLETFLPHLREYLH